MIAPRAPLGLRPRGLVRLAVLAALQLAVAAAPGVAAAQGKPPSGPSAADKDQARTLFREGATAVEEGRPADGLPKLEQAEALFHAPTHLLYIARAQAALGKLLDARATYEKLVGEQLPKGVSSAFKDAQASGRKELDELDKRIPRVVVRVEPAGASGLVVTLDGGTFPPERLGESFAFDPGTHTFEATAEGDLRSDKVTVEASERTTTEVRLLLRDAKARAASVDGGSSVVTASSPGARELVWGPIRITGVSMIGVGAAGLVAGGVFAGLHFVKKGEADDLYASCTSFPCAVEGEIEDLDATAATFGTVSIIGLAAGGALLGAGLTMFFVGEESSDAPPQAPDATTVSVELSPGWVGVRGTF